MMALEGGSFGFQDRWTSYGLVLLVMNESGGEGHSRQQGQAGRRRFRGRWPGRPRCVCRHRRDPAFRNLELLKARGLFAGVSLEGSTIRADNGDNRRVYGRKIPAREIVLSGTVAVPPAAEQLIATLDAKTPKHRT